MTMDSRRSEVRFDFIHLAILLGILHVGPAAATYCQNYYNETDAILMCQATHKTISSTGTIFIDSTGAPNFQSLQCECNITMEKSQTVEVYYRSQGGLVNGTNCVIQFQLNDRTWGCQMFDTPMKTTVSSSFNKLRYVKYDENTNDYSACIGITHVTGSMSIQCAASMPYVPPGATTSSSSTTTTTTTTTTTPKPTTPIPPPPTTTTTTPKQTTTTPIPTTTTTTPKPPPPTTQKPTTTTTTPKPPPPPPTTPKPPPPTTKKPTTPTTTPKPPPPTTSKPTTTTTTQKPAPTTTLKPTTATPISPTTTTTPRPQRPPTTTSQPTTPIPKPATTTSDDNSSGVTSAVRGTGPSVDWTLIGSIIGSLVLLAAVIALIFFLLKRRRTKKRPKIQSQFSTTSGDVIITENELYHYDGENPARAYNALFVGGIPNTPGAGTIDLPPRFRTGTADKKIVVPFDDTKPRPRPKPPAKPNLRSFRGASYVDSTDQTSVKHADDALLVNLPLEQMGEQAALSVYNPGFDQGYLNSAQLSNNSSDHLAPSDKASVSPYDYIDHTQLMRDSDLGSVDNDNDGTLDFDDDFSDVTSTSSRPYHNLPDRTGSLASDRYKRIIDVTALTGVSQPDATYMTSFVRS